MSLLNLLDYNLAALQEILKSWREPAYRATQILQWVHQKQQLDFNQMTNLNQPLKQQLSDYFNIILPEIIFQQQSQDGTIKFLLKLTDQKTIEMVLIPDGDRNTLCVSSQVGCALRCEFCATGYRGYDRNLELSEIIGQIWLAKNIIAHNNLPRLKNIVFMGMGEPLLNFDNVIAALSLLRDDRFYNLSKYRITISTAGIIPKIYELSKQSDVSLAISLHAPFNELRNRLVPINKKYPLEQLIQACREFFKDNNKNINKKRSILIEYVMLKNINDQKIHALELIKILKNLPCKINLIPFNSVKEAPFQCSDYQQILDFQAILNKSGLRTLIRQQRGSDIDGACGQLQAKFNINNINKTSLPIKILN